jgi:hypothetical protein
MSEQFYTSTLKKRRKGRRMTAEQRIRAQAQFLDAYEKTANVLKAAEQAEVDRTLVYYWLEHDENFLFAYGIADKAVNVHIEAEIHRRGVEGVDKPLVSMGHLVYEGKGKERKKVVIREYSDTLLIFLAKKRMPEYRDRSAVTVNVLPKVYEFDPNQDGVEDR